jgi:hypothetical protein
VASSGEIQVPRQPAIHQGDAPGDVVRVASESTSGNPDSEKTDRVPPILKLAK